MGTAEKLGRDTGLDWIFCDTDSMAFAKPADMTDKTFQDKVKTIRDWFVPLNPYKNKPEMFKLEDANFALNPDGRASKNLHPLYCLAVSAKRYVLFNFDANGNPVIRKASAHGLGHFKPPYETREERPDLPAPAFQLNELVGKTGVNLWQHDVWYQIILNNLSGKERINPTAYPVFRQPAVRKYAATTPELANWFRLFNKDKAYKDQVKPFNFLLAYKADRIKKPRVLLNDEPRQAKTKSAIYYPSVVAPFDSNLRRAVEKCFDRKTGIPVLPDELESYQTSLSRYHMHPEMKFSKGGEEDRGYTERRHIIATEIRNIGKEANRLEEQSELEAIPEAQIEYGTTPESEKRFFAHLKNAVEKFTARAVALKASLSERQLQKILIQQDKPHTQTRARLIRAIILLEKEWQQLEREGADCVKWLKNKLLHLDKAKRSDLAKMFNTVVPDLRKMAVGTRKLSKKVLEAYREAIDP